MKKRPIAVKLLCVLPLAALLIGPSLAAAQTNQFFGALRAGQLVGLKVEDSDGAIVGTVRNLVLDLHDGKLKYVVIGSGGFLGLRATLKVAPSRDVSAATTKRQTLAIDVSTPQWNAAPVCKTANLAELENPQRAEEISVYFRTIRNHATNATSPSLSVTGRNTQPAVNATQPDLKFVSDLMGRHVVDAKQEKIGEISDVLIRFGTPRTVFAIIASGRVFHHGNQFVVPLNALSQSGKEKKLALNMDSSLLQDAPLFNREVWESDGTNGASRIFRYSKAEERTEF